MPVERRRRLSRCHGSKISGSQQTVVLADKKNEKIDMYDFPVHDCTQEQNGSPYFSSIDRQRKWPSLLFLLTCKNFAVMVMSRNTSPLYWFSFDWLGILTNYICL